MEGSFATVMGGGGQRNDDLPSAAFRWVGRYFEVYIGEKCYELHRYGGCLRYLTRAWEANPVLLLKPRMYKTGTKSLLGLIPAPIEKNGIGTNLYAKKGRKRPFILDAIFRHLELARWSAALKRDLNR